MMSGYLVRLVVSTVAAAALLFPAGASINAAKLTGYAARANFRDATGDGVTSDGMPRAYAGSIDRTGNFSFSTGTQRAVQIAFGAPLALLGGQVAPLNAWVPNDTEPVTFQNVTFKTLTPSAGGSLLDIVASSPQVRSVQFGLPAAAGDTASQYGLHFRGNALFDDNGDGVGNGPGDGVEMSRMLVTCDSVDGIGCRVWTFVICVIQCPGDSNPEGGSPGTGTGIGQLYGTFPNKVGTRPIARYALDWGMTLCRETEASCP